MFIWLAKKFENFTGEGLRLHEVEASAFTFLQPSRLLAVFAFACVLATTFSIAVSQIFLGASIACWLYILWRHRQWNSYAIAPVYTLALFTAAAVLATAMSPRPLYSLGYLKKFWIYSLLWVIPMAFRQARQVARLYCWIAVGATISAGVAIFQYFFNPHISLVNRVTGLTGHWMTFAGLQMLSLLALLALLLTDRSANYRWIYPAIPIQVFALALSQTRSAWFGFFAGLLTLVCLTNRRWIWAVCVAAGSAYWLLPQQFQQRLQASTDLSDSTTRIRVELLRTGWNMIKAHPFFGVGPRMIPIEYPLFNTTNEFPAWVYQHLHNNFVQIAAELGLGGLLAWLALLATFAVHSARQLTDGQVPEPRKFAARAALACIVALLVAGLFEYNFGDSEVLMLFLFVVTSPYVIFRETASPADASQ